MRIDHKKDKAGSDAIAHACQQLEDLLQPLTVNPSGAGLDIPEWLEHLEEEVKRVGKEPPPRRSPVVPISLQELRQQLNDLERPLGS
jgi:HPt (histidine-containing phosphotransfer) domain-containing protein